MVEFVPLKFTIYYDLNPYEVKHAPKGWSEAGFGSALDKSYKTTKKQFKGDFTFFFESANLLRDIYYKNGASAKALLRIEKFNVATFLYEEEELSDFDFTTWNDDITGVTVALKPSSIASNIEAFMDTVFEIEVDETNNAIPINIGGIGVGEGATFIDALEATGFGGFNTFLPSLTVSDSSVIGTTIMELNSGYSNATIYMGNVATFAYNYFMKINAPTAFQVRLTGSIKAGGAGYYLNQIIYFTIYDSDGNNQILGTTYFTGYKFQEQPLILNFDKTINVQPGKRYTLAMFSPVVNEGAYTYSMSIDSIDMKIDYSTYTIDYFAQGLRAGDLFRAIMKKINPNPVLNISSDLLDNTWRTLVVLSGDCLRGIPGAKINTSFRQFLDSMIPELFAGFKVYQDDSIRLEVLTFFYNAFVKAGNLGEVSDLKLTTIKEMYFSKITVGYQDQEYDKTEGKDEFNTEEVWSAPETSFKNNIEIKSFYRADARGIDQLLLDYRADQTVDSKADKENFMVQVREVIDVDGNYHLLGPEEFQNVEGTSALGRIYNLNLTPRMMLIRNSPLLAVPFSLNQQGYINFESSKKNAGLKITRNDGTVFIEKAPLPYQDMRAPIWKPIQAEATLKISDLQYKNIISNAQKSNGYVEFSFKGVNYEGFIIEDEFNLTQDNKKTFKFYLTPNSNLPI